MNKNIINLLYICVNILFNYCTYDYKMPTVCLVRSVLYIMHIYCNTNAVVISTNLKRGLEQTYHVTHCSAGDWSAGPAPPG